MRGHFFFSGPKKKKRKKMQSLWKNVWQKWTQRTSFPRLNVHVEAQDQPAFNNFLAIVGAMDNALSQNFFVRDWREALFFYRLHTYQLVADIQLNALFEKSVPDIDQMFALFHVPPDLQVGLRQSLQRSLD